MAWFRHECVPKITGAPPQAAATDVAATVDAESRNPG
jgi:xanthosine utilization system XapX-like protein